jgi:hypothetical protein
MSINLKRLWQKTVRMAPTLRKKKRQVPKRGSASATVSQLLVYLDKAAKSAKEKTENKMREYQRGKYDSNINAFTSDLSQVFLAAIMILGKINAADTNG